MPSISPTTLFVTGSITCTLSPALFVWRMRTLPLCAWGDALPIRAASTEAATIASSEEIRRVMVMSSLIGSGRRLAHHESLQRQPFGIVLRLEVLAAVVEEVAASGFLERMDQQHALRAAGHHRHAAHDVEVLPRLLVVPRRLARRKRL